mgnify:CR=1 FL=1
MIYGWGLRRTETAKLDLVDWARNPHAPQFGRFGSLSVRYGKAKRGQPPRRRTVLSMMSWAVEADQRWALARRLLHDDTLAIEDRLAGLLVVLHAQTATRI